VGGYSTGLVRQSDGNLVVAGQSSDGRFELARYQGLSPEPVAFDVLNSVPGSGLKAAGHPWHANAVVDNQGSITTPSYAVDFFLYQFDANATLALAKEVKVTKALKASKTRMTTWHGDSDGSFGAPINASPWSPQPGQYALTVCLAPDMNNPAAYDTCRTTTFVIAPAAPTGTTASVLPTSMQWQTKAGSVGKSSTLKIGLVNTGTSAASPPEYFIEENGSVILTSQQSPLPALRGTKAKTETFLLFPNAANDYEFQFCLGTTTAPVNCLYSVFTVH